MSDDLVRRAIRGLKRCGPFHYRSDDELNPLDCSLAGRVARVFGVGITSAAKMCQDAGEDPDYREPQSPVCYLCPNDAECRASNGEYYCGDCCTHDGDGVACVLLEDLVEESDL